MAITSNFPAIRPSLNLDFANAKALDPRITFSRASAATYYDGKTVAKAEENLFISSQLFSSAGWVLAYSSIVSNSSVAPDGTATATKLLADNSQNYHGIRQGLSLPAGNVYTVSVYAKAAEFSKLYFSDLANGRVAARFDLVSLSSDNPASSPGYLASSVSDIGGGWRRCVVTFSAGSSTISLGFTGYPDTGANLGLYGANYTGDGTSGIYIWGAQLEQRSQVTAYTPTTTQPIINYIPVLQTALAGVPRFDHNPVTGESLGLLGVISRCL
ncbi:phage head spike fiber domain-containing protein, partial [Malikia granosa]|uniref:phage head spike fiber domain-containing protein n=1 Tax=Malikia granosa TaxID=263067 RepID=UPI001B80DAEE